MWGHGDRPVLTTSSRSLGVPAPQMSVGTCGQPCPVPSPSLGPCPQVVSAQPYPFSPRCPCPTAQCGDNPARTQEPGASPCIWGHFRCHWTVAQLGAQSHPSESAGRAESGPLCSASPSLEDRSLSSLKSGCLGCAGVSPPPWGHPGRSPWSSCSSREGTSQQHPGQRSLGQKPGRLAGEWGDQPPCSVAVVVAVMLGCPTP